jgi:hypothetical protein
MNDKESIYTSGAIEFTEDAYSWRKDVLKGLHEHYKVIIPDLIPCPFKKTDMEYPGWVKKHFIIPDMNDVATCNHIFVYLDHIYSSGTYGELSLASWLNKDIVCYLDNEIKIETLPIWIIGCLNNATFVNSVDEGIEHYKSLIKET